MFSHRGDDDYAVQLWKDVWRVHKFDGYHGSHLGYYVVKLVGDEWACNCPAGLDGKVCKHFLMVENKMKEMIENKTTSAEHDDGCSNE